MEFLKKKYVKLLRKILDESKNSTIGWICRRMLKVQRNILDGCGKCEGGTGNSRKREEFPGRGRRKNWMRWEFNGRDLENIGRESEKIGRIWTILEEFGQYWKKNKVQVVGGISVPLSVSGEQLK